MNNSMKKTNAIYSKHGAMQDAEPKFMPDARGLLMVLQCKHRENQLTDEQFAAVNLCAQGELKAQSEEYKRAQEWWSNFPHTPARQLDSCCFTLPSFAAGEKEIEKWLAQYDEKDGLVYVFSVERKFNLRFGSIQRHIPVTVFSGGSMESLDSIEEKDCIHFRVYFAYYEKPETLTDALHIRADSLTAVEKQELHN